MIVKYLICYDELLMLVIMMCWSFKWSNWNWLYCLNWGYLRKMELLDH